MDQYWGFTSYRDRVSWIGACFDVGWPPLVHRAFDGVRLQVFLMAEESGWCMSEPLETAVSSMFSCIGQTNTDENGFKVQRVKETASCQRALSGKRKWLALISSRITSTMFRYLELPNFRSASIPAGYHWRDMKALYAARVSSSWQKLKGVVGTNRVPEWFSPAPRNEIAGDVDLSAWRLMHSKGCLNQVDKLFASSLLSCSRMVVSNSVAPRIIGRR